MLWPLALLQVSEGRYRRNLLAQKEFEALLQRARFEEAKRKEIWRESERGKGSESRASARFGAGADRSDPAGKERHTEGGSRNQP